MRLVLLASLTACCPVEPSRIVPVAPAPIAPPGPACIVAGDDLELERMVVTDDSVAFCFVRPSGWRCLAMDLATGAFRAVAPPTRDPVLPVTHRVDIQHHGAYACRGDDCVELQLPPGADVASFHFRTNTDGTRVVATDDRRVTVFDAATGRSASSFKLETEFCIAGASRFLGETLYVPICGGAGPATHASLFRLDGTRIDDPVLNVYGTEPVHVRGDVWAFRDIMQPAYVVHDVRTGRTLHRLEAKRPERARLVFDDLDRYAPVLGRIPTRTALERTPSGRLVAVGAFVDVIDPARGSLASHAVPICP